MRPWSPHQSSFRCRRRDGYATWCRSPHRDVAKTMYQRADADVLVAQTPSTTSPCGRGTSAPAASLALRRRALPYSVFVSSRPHSGTRRTRPPSTTLRRRGVRAPAASHHARDRQRALPCRGKRPAPAWRACAVGCDRTCPVGIGPQCRPVATTPRRGWRRGAITPGHTKGEFVLRASAGRRIPAGTSIAPTSTGVRLDVDRATRLPELLARTTRVWQSARVCVGRMRLSDGPRALCGLTCVAAIAILLAGCRDSTDVPTSAGATSVVSQVASTSSSAEIRRPPSAPRDDSPTSRRGAITLRPTKGEDRRPS